MIELRPYQIEAARQLNRFRGRALLADEMGLGKTIEFLFWLSKHPKIRPAIVVCPAGLKYNWQREAKKHFGMGSYVCNGTSPAKGFVPDSELVIINYKIIGHWYDFLRALKPKCIAMDECHYLKNRDSDRTENTKRIARKIRYRIAISGTPQTNRPAELWPVLNLIAPEAYNSFWSFSQEFCKPQRRFGRWMHTGAKNLPTLHKQLKARCMVRRLKKDVLKDLPPKVRQIVPMKIRNPEEYAHARDNFLDWLGEKSPERMEKASRALAITRMGYLKRLAARLKIRAVYDWVKDFFEETDEKLVLFGVHKKAIDFLHKKFPRVSLVIDGTVTGADRQRAVDIFQRHGRYRLLIGNIRAAGVGITLTAAASAAFFEMGWTPGEHTQAEDRIHRFGQHQTAFIYYLIGMNTIEEHLCDIIQTKQKVQNETLDGGASGDDLDVYDQLMERLREDGHG